MTSDHIGTDQPFDTHLRPQRFFISYARKCELSVSLADYLCDRIKQTGHEVFVDVSMKTGDDWDREIERRLDEWCDYLVILVSKLSIESDMVKGEVRRAHARRRRHGTPQFLPVRVRFDGSLGFELDSYLNGVQHGSWFTPADSNRVATDILGIASRRSSPTQSVHQASTVTRTLNNNALRDRLLGVLQGVSLRHLTVFAAIALSIAGAAGYATRHGDQAIIITVIGAALYSFLFAFRYEIASISLVIILLGNIGNRLLQHTRLTAVIRHSDRFFTDFVLTRDSIKSIYRKIPINTEISYEDETTVLESFNKFLLRSANTLQALFSDYTRDRCHVAIKTFNRKDNVVTTAVRDGVSLMRADKDDDPKQLSRPYWKNSAFTKILEDPDCSFYYSNRLIYKAFFKKYYSGHVGWQRLYSAAIIIPITTHRSGSMINSSSVCGFICVDNKAGRFNGRDCAELLFAFARAYCELFNLVGRIHHKRQGEETGRSTISAGSKRGGEQDGRYS